MKSVIYLIKKQQFLPETRERGKRAAADGQQSGDPGAGNRTGRSGERTELHRPPPQRAAAPQPVVGRLASEVREDR